MSCYSLLSAGFIQEYQGWFHTKICSFIPNYVSGTKHIGAISSDDKEIIDLTNINPKIFSSFFSMADEAARANEGLDAVIESKLEAANGKLKTYAIDQIVLKIPLVPPEVWAGGVTYLRSRQAREVETSLKGLYNYVYDARRPEVFFKTTGLRCVGPEEDVGIRSDSKWSVPEPELTVVFGKDCEVLGYTIGNDMSARDIEGENPLYLPQAKVFRNCCALGPVISTRKEIPDPRNLQIDMKIVREGKIMFHGSVSTSQMKRTIEELVSFLKSNNTIPPCSVFMTGTGIVPPDDFTLIDKDVIEIEIEGIGKLRNTARVLS
ncbi:MAG: fumarylacetoacetate hydrolase family protein [archaeon]|nr:fumarylacetoacetate hydrolase family protein [archaeon]